MNRNNANVTRLRVNRIALIQKIDTEEILPKLVRSQILSTDHDVPYINQGTSKIDRARRLIDCLLDHQSSHNQRPTNWFLLFRKILLENPSNYKTLVTALDNTIIRKPNVIQPLTDISTKQFNMNSVNEQERIVHIEFDRYAMNKIFLKGHFHRLIDDPTYYSQIPEYFLTQLSQSKYVYDHEQLYYEHQTFNRIRQFELTIHLLQQEKSFSKENLFNTEIVNSILTDLAHQHYFYKYFYMISSINGIHYDQQLVQKNLFEKIIEKGFLLYHFLYNYGRYEYCRDIIESIIQILRKENNKQQALFWIYLFRACCALIQVHNQTLQIKEAWARIEAANEIAENLKSTGIEISNNDRAWLYFVSSQTAYEDGNFDACVQYSYRGLKLVDQTNHSLIVDLLCSFTQGLIAKSMMIKAQSTAIMTVQYAAKHCGRNSPKYICALQKLVQYSNEFIQDPTSVELAQYTFDRAQFVYGYESLSVAHCHRVLSKSLINLATVHHYYPNNQEDRKENLSIKDCPPSAYLHHANEAYRIAEDWFGIDNLICLFPFKMSLSHALQARIAANICENKTNYYEKAIEYLNECLLITETIFGLISFKVAQIHRLLSAVYLSNQMSNEAEQELDQCLQIYKLCLPPNSFHYLDTQANLASFYKQQGDYQRASFILEKIVRALNPKTQSYPWINHILDHLFDCYSHLQTEHERVTIQKIRSHLNEYRHTNIKRINLMNCIHQESAY